MKDEHADTDTVDIVSSEWLRCQRTSSAVFAASNKNPHVFYQETA